VDETPKVRKPRSDKGVKRGPRRPVDMAPEIDAAVKEAVAHPSYVRRGRAKAPPLVVRAVPRIMPADEEKPPVLVIVDGEEVRCNAWAFEFGFLKLSYWPENRGRIGTRYIAVSGIKDLRVEQPREMPVPNPALFTSPALAAQSNVEPGPQTYVNPIVAAMKRDPKLHPAEAMKDPMGVRPMTKLVDEQGRVTVVEAAMA
jgi:hypothetical protein